MSRQVVRGDSLLACLVRKREGGLLAFVLLTVAVVGVAEPRFLTWENGRDILTRAAPTAIVACGVMLVIVTAEIDISVGSLMAVLAAVMGRMLSADHADWPLWQGVLLTLLLGTACGTLTGGLVTIGRVPSIIVTLGLLTALRGASIRLMGGENIDDLPERLTQLAKYGPGGLPLAVWVAAATVALTWYLIHWTPLGRRLYAVGSNAESAQMVGLSATQLKVFVFAFTGFLTAVATLVEVPRLPKIEAGIGSEFELLVVTCVVVGGVSIRGGRGSLLGVMLAILLMTMIRPVLTFWDVGEAGERWTKAIQGAFILVAVVSDSLAGQRDD